TTSVASAPKPTSTVFGASESRFGRFAESNHDLRPRDLRSVDRARELGDALPGGDLVLRLRCTLELALEPVELLLGIAVSLLRISEVLPDQVEIVLEAPEVLLELRTVRHHLVRVLLDLEALQAEHDHLQVRRERRRRDRQHAHV